MKPGDLVRLPDCETLTGGEECGCYCCHFDFPRTGVVLGYNLEESIGAAEDGLIEEGEGLWDVAFGQTIWPVGPREVEVINESR